MQPHLPLLFTLCLVALPSCTAPRGAFDRGEPTVRLDGSGLALAGYDPVSYFEDDGPQLGSAVHAAQHNGATYHFVSAAHRQRFAVDPDRYAPAYGGWCAWAVAASDGVLVEVDPRSYVVQDGQLMLFFDGLLANTRAMWLARDTRELKGVADANWRRLESTAK